MDKEHTMATHPTAHWIIGFCLLTMLLIGGILLTGCVDHQKEIDTYRAVLAGHAPTTTRPANTECPAGTTLSLIEAMALASRDGERLAIQGEAYLQALIDKDRAFSVFMPTITLNPVYYDREPFDRMTMPGFMTPRHTFDVPVNASMTAFDGFRNVTQLRAAAKTIDQQRELLLDLQATILLETSQVYYAVLKAERSVQVLKNSLAVQEKRVADVNEKLAQGVAKKLDLEQARAQAAATRVQLTQAQRAVVAGRATLATLIGVPRIDATLTDRYATPDATDDLPTQLDIAMKNRRDLKAADAAMAAARQAVDHAVGQYYPSIRVNFQSFLYQETWPDDSKWNGLLEANLPIFTGGRIHADVRTAWSRFRQAVHVRALTERQVREQVSLARIDFTSSIQQIRDLHTQVQATESAFRIASQSYNQGLATNLDVLDAHDRLLSARLALAAEEFDRTVFYINLLRTTGRLDTFTDTTLPPAPMSQPATE
jgi:outer membrane protein TolC